MLPAKLSRLEQTSIAGNEARVMGVVNRAYAELLTTASDGLAAIPEGLDNEQAGALPLVTTTGAQLMDRFYPNPARPCW